MILPSFSGSYSGDLSEVRYRVDTLYGYVSYSSLDLQKALDLLEEGGLRLRVCRDMYDDGIVIIDTEKQEKDDIVKYRN